MKGLTKKFLLAAVCLGFTGTMAMAETAADQETYRLGEVVVTGEKTSVADIAITHTITADDIKTYNSKTVADALTFAPGVTVTRGRKNEAEVSVHGFNQEKTLFLIDGIPYYETYYGKLNLDQIPVDIIAKIEITKNAPSVLYGPNAQVAVVNVITQQGTEKPTFHFEGDISKDDTYDVSVSHGNQVGKINYWLNYNHQESDGWPLSDDFDPETAVRVKKFMPNLDGIHEDGGRRENSDYDEDKFWARVGLTPTENAEYFLSFHTLQSEKGHPLATNEYRIFTRSGDSPAFSTFARFEKYDDWGLDLSGRQAINDNLTLRGKIFYHDHEDEYASYDSPEIETVIAKSTYKDSILGTSLFSDFSAADFHQGHVSLHYKKDDHESRDDNYLPWNDYASYTGSVGTEHQFRPTDALTVYAGVSYDWFNIDEAEDYVFDDDDNLIGQTSLDTPDTEDEINPMVGFDFLLGDATFYGSIAKKTRFPALFQLYSSQGGNPDLSSEETVNYTLGVRKALGARLAVDVAAFYHDISDWISRDYYQDDYTGAMLYTNTEDIAMTGLEITLTAAPTDFCRLNLNYTFNDADNRSNDRATGRVANVPEHKLGVGCGLTVPVLLAKIDLQGVYVDEMYDSLPTTASPDTETTTTDPYFVLNGRISKTFKEMITCFIEFDNIFDRDYEQEIGFPGKGRTYRAGLSARF